MAKALQKPFTALCVVGIVACIIVNLAIDGRITWGVFPLASIVFGWLVIMPLLHFKRHRVALSALSATLFIVPFLWVIFRQLNGDWFVPIVLPITIIGIAFMWLLVLLFCYVKINLWYKFSIAAVLAAAMDYGVDSVLKSTDTTGAIISVISILLCAVILAVVGKQKAGHKTKA